MPRDGPMFASLRRKNQRGISRSDTPRANNTTLANSISLTAGNLIVGVDQNARVYGNKLGIATGMGSASSATPTGSAANDTNTATLLPTVGNSAAPTMLAGSVIAKKKNRSHQLDLSYHESRYSSELVMMDMAAVPGSNEGDLCELKTYSGIPHVGDRKIYFIAKDFDAESKRRFKSAQLSILSGQLQSILDLPTRSKVWVKLKSKKEAEADLVELNIRDCLINRGDMWYLSSQLVDTCVFSPQKLTFLDSIRATVKGIYRNGRKLLSGYIGENTRVVFRSESARLIFLIQITDEMWNFEETGEQLFQRMVNSFFPKIFKKWKEIDTHHSITIAFATPVDMSDVPYRELKPGEILKNTTDYFRIVVDQVHVIHWVEIMETLRKEFMDLTKDILNVKTEDKHSVIKGKFSPVIKSNILELVNFATTILTDPFKQPDLRHTTTHVIIISPGSGLYDVDYDLLKLTGKKLLSLEMTMDLVCLSRAPLHVVPLFRYLDYENKLHHCCPTWLSIFFWNETSKASDEWYPRCKIYDLQMMGLTQNDVVQEVNIAYMNPGKNVTTISKLMDCYDRDVFNCTQLTHFSESNQAPNFLTESKKQEIINKSAQKASTFIWNAPKFANPVLEVVQTPKVLADMYTVRSNDTSLEADSNSEILSPSGTRGQPTSLAVDKLKGITKKSSVKDVTQRIVNKLVPDWNQKKDKKLRADLFAKPENKYDAESAMDKSLSTTISRSYLNSPENVPIIKKNLSALDSPDNESLAKSAPDNDSIRESVSTMNSSKYSNTVEGRPFIIEERRMRHEERMKRDATTPRLVDESWIEIRNPSVPVSSETAELMLAVRWNDVIPRYVAKKYNKWRSFTTPAELPITLSDFPSKQDFETNFILRNHSVTLNIDQESYNQSYKDLLRNMIYMRLLTGFQICVGESTEKVELSISQDNEESPIAKYTDGNWTSRKIYMMVDSEIHRISCGMDGVIDVQRYLRKNEQNTSEQVPSYVPLVKTRYENEYRSAEIDPLHASRDSFNWNQIDQVLAGYGDDGLDRKPYGFRSKLVVLPADIPPNTLSSIISGRNETLTPEEIRLEGLRRLIASINRAKLRTSKEKLAKNNKREEIQQEIMFYTGSLFDFIHEQKASLEKSVLDYKDSIFATEKRQLKKDVDLKILAHELQHGDNPLTLVNRKWHWKKHQNSFIGSEMVNWLIRNFRDIDTREEAIDYGQNLMGKGLFVHVLNKHGFLDGHYFYQISPEYIIDSRALEKINSHPKSASEIKRAREVDSVSSVSDSNTAPVSIVYRKNSDISHEDHSDINQTSGSAPKPTVVLSSSVDIDVDTAAKSYKLETCTVHHDKVHNPDHCFHIRLEWLTTTPKLLDDLVGNWSRLCERYGLRLIEIPWKELCTIPATNPFHSFVDIKLAINPWEDPEFRDLDLFSASRFYYHMYLLKSSGFLLDNRASTFLQGSECEFDIIYSWGKPVFKYAQYIHNTGAYIAEIRENGNLFLAPNNIYISRVNPGNVVGKAQSSPQFAIDAQRVMLNFRETCTNYEKLRTILLKAREKWIKDQIYDDY